MLHSYKYPQFIPSNKRYFILKKVSGTQRVTKKFGRRGAVLIANARGKVPEHRSGLRPSEKEFPGRRSDAFRHKNTPADNVRRLMHIIFLHMTQFSSAIGGVVDSRHLVDQDAWFASTNIRAV
jgi:hypothetical protein